MKWILGWVAGVATIFTFGAPASADRAITFSEYKSPAAGICGGVGCCIKGDSEAGQACVRKVYSLVPGRTGGMVAIHPITKVLKKKTKEGQSLLMGLGDSKGRTLVEPKYAEVEPISETTAWAQRTDGTQVLVDMKGKERPFPYKRLEVAIAKSERGYEQIDNGEQPQIAFGTNDVAAGPTTLTQLGLDGEPSGLVMQNVREGFVNDRFYIFQTVGAEGQLASFFIDKATGKLAKIGPGIKRHNVYAGQYNCHSTGSDKSPWYLNIEMGPSPMKIGTDSHIYLPLDSAGEPMALPSGILGVVPYGGRETGECVTHWVVVSKVGSGYEYRVGGWSPAEALAAHPRLAKIDGIEFEYSNRSRMGLNGVREWNYLTVRPAGQPDWVQAVHEGRNELTEASLRKGQRGPTPMAVANALVEKQVQVIYAAEAERKRIADEAAVAYTELLSYFDMNIGHSNVDKNKLLSAARQAGGEYAKKYAAAYPKDNADILCSLQVMSACQTVRQSAEADAAFWTAKREAESAFRHALTTGYSVPELQVRVITNFGSNTMGISDYRRIYGQ